MYLNLKTGHIPIQAVYVSWDHTRAHQLLRRANREALEYVELNDRMNRYYPTFRNRSIKQLILFFYYKMVDIPAVNGQHRISILIPFK